MFPFFHFSVSSTKAPARRSRRRPRLVDARRRRTSRARPPAASASETRAPAPCGSAAPRHATTSAVSHKSAARAGRDGFFSVDRPDVEGHAASLAGAPGGRCTPTSTRTNSNATSSPPRRHRPRTRSGTSTLQSGTSGWGSRARGPQRSVASTKLFAARIGPPEAARASVPPIVQVTGRIAQLRPYASSLGEAGAARGSSGDLSSSVVDRLGKGTAGANPGVRTPSVTHQPRAKPPREPEAAGERRRTTPRANARDLPVARLRRPPRLWGRHPATPSRKTLAISQIQFL